MAKFIMVEKDKYKIVGILTDEDISRINTFKNRTTLILDNTVGLSSELISKINSDRVVFSIKGGLDYEQKEKYKSQKYINRTFVSPSGLKKIIRYFEYNESLIDSNWNEFEKAMFLYNALVVDMEYAENYENIQSPGTTERSLNGILYGKLVCAGFTLVYKEMLDRIGIKNYYQNQKNVHAFNIIEIDGKKYGLDVTWENIDKEKNNGICGFGRFAQDPEFYTRHGHQLYEEVDTFNDFEKTVLESDEEVYDLSLLDTKQLKEYYSHIASSITNRKPFKYNLLEQPLEIKNKYLPVDTVDFELKREANQECHIIIILDFLKKRNALQTNPQLIEAFSSRKNYLLDIREEEYLNSKFNLSKIGLNNYEINENGNLFFEDGNNRKFDQVSGVFAGNSTISQDKLGIVYNSLNQYLTKYFNKYISDILKNIDKLLENFEYKPDEFDSNRYKEYANIYTKLSIIVNSRDYLIQLGCSEEEINNIIQKVTNKYNQIHKPYNKETHKKDFDLEFLSAFFGDLNFIRKTIEDDLQKQITEEEFISLLGNTDYILKIFEQYIKLGNNPDEYTISKEDLQLVLNKIIQDYQKTKLDSITNLNEIQESQRFGMRK